MYNTQQTFETTNTDKYYLKFLKYKTKYEKLYNQINLLDQTGGNTYNVHHTGGEVGNAQTAAQVANIAGWQQWFRNMREWSQYHDNPAISESDRTEARGQIQTMLNEINGLFTQAGSPTRFRWTSVSWNKGSTWLN
jgi:hypothetical protein